MKKTNKKRCAKRLLTLVSACLVLAMYALVIPSSALNSTSGQTRNYSIASTDITVNWYTNNNSYSYTAPINGRTSSEGNPITIKAAGNGTPNTYTLAQKTLGTANYQGSTYDIATASITQSTNTDGYIYNGRLSVSVNGIIADLDSEYYMIPKIFLNTSSFTPSAAYKIRANYRFSINYQNPESGAIVQSETLMCHQDFPALTCIRLKDDPFYLLDYTSLSGIPVVPTSKTVIDDTIPGTYLLPENKYLIYYSFCYIDSIEYLIDESEKESFVITDLIEMCSLSTKGHTQSALSAKFYNSYNYQTYAGSVGKWMADSVGSFLSVKLFGTFALGDILLVVISISVAFFFLKTFAGG